MDVRGIESQPQESPSQHQSLQCGAATFNKLSFDPPVRSSPLPSGRLVYVPLEQLVGGDICRLVTTATSNTVFSFSSYQQIITTCGDCTECPVGLSNIHAYLQRMLKDFNVSLIVIVRGVSYRQMNNVEDEKKIRFAFIEEETPVALDDCQILDGADGDALRSFSKTSVLFVSISFIILMVISLAWLVFYYVQRFRYAHAKDRLQRRLFNAAKKALTRIPTRPIRVGDKELDTDCPVCIDPYRTGDIIRSLPCRHIFHKTCVDPWLLEHRTCPMCKSDILKAFGYYVSVGRRIPNNAHRESVHQSRDGDMMSVDIHSLTGSETVFPYTTHSETQDLVNITPTTSPQLVQVMHCSNTNTFAIAPLAVHAAPSPVHFASESQNVIAHSEQTKNAAHRISWQIRRPSTTASHVVNVVRVRSRSLSHPLSPSEPRKPKATSSSNTFSLGVTSLHFSSVPPKSVLPVSRNIRSSVSAIPPDFTAISFPTPSVRTDFCIQPSVKLRNINSRNKQRQELSNLASVESL
uniref:RING-type domain-containing protein n=1 Tax=Setaria digitata TaxID=48799 RepID=A0A915Q711_9BILA